MCLAVLSWQPQSKFPLTVVANRDEFRDRPTQAMHWWTNGILAGKDLQAGGTWLGINRHKKFALLTNIRPGFIGKKGDRSRGELVTQFLENNESIDTYHQKVTQVIDRYAGFNLIIGDGKQLFWFSTNHPEGEFLKPGIYGLSNDALNTPWPKLELAKQQLLEQLDNVHVSLFDHNILLSSQQAPKNLLPRTGLPSDWEANLSAQCILGEDYGTRCRTHIVQSTTDKTRICEQQLNSLGQITQATHWTIG